MHWVAKGKTDAEIATILGMSPRTVQKHLEQIYQKLSVENRTAAAAKAYEIASLSRHYRSSGHVWQGRFKAFPVEQDEHLLTISIFFFSIACLFF